MKYWIFQNNQVGGPYEPEDLTQLPSFSAESLVCPEGKKGTNMGDWQRAGMLPELSHSLVKSTQLMGAGRSSGPVNYSSLPPEPTLKDLAALGSLQEKFTLLESTVAQLQDEMRLKDRELTGLNTEVDDKNRLLDDLTAKLGSIEARLTVFNGLRDNLDQAVAAEKSVESTVEVQRQSLETMNLEISRLKTEISGIEALRAGVKEIDALKNEMHGMGKLKAADIEQLKSEVKAIEAVQAEAKGSAREKASEIELLRSEVKEIGTLRGELQDMEKLKASAADIEKIKADFQGFEKLKASIADVEQLKNEVKEIDQLKKEIKEIGSRPEAKPLETPKPTESPKTSAAPPPVFSFEPSPAAPKAEPVPESIMPPPVPLAPVSPFEFEKTEPPMTMPPVKAPPQFFSNPGSDLPEALSKRTDFSTPPPVAPAALKSDSPKPKDKKKLILFGIGGLAALGIGLYIMGGSASKKKSEPPATVAVAPVPEPVPVPVAAPVAVQPPAAPPTPSPAGTPAAPTTNSPAPTATPDPQEGQLKSAALDLVKLQPIPNGTATVGEQLESAYPSSGGLPAWMVEKIKGDSYQVNFYAPKTPNTRQITYEFEARLSDKKVLALNEAAAAVLAGTPRVSAVSKRKRRIRVRSKPKRTAPNSDQALLNNLFGEADDAAKKPQAEPAAPAAISADAAPEDALEPTPSAQAKSSKESEETAPKKLPETESLDDLLKP